MLPAYSTLLLAGGLAAAPAAAAPSRGDLVITEIMPAPKGDASNCEWLEVAATGGAVDLTGCRLLEVDASDPGSVESAALDGITIPASATASSPAVLARDTASCRAEGASTVDCVAYDADGNCLVAPTGTYSGVSINNSGERILCIACGSAFSACDTSAGDTIVDELSFDWSSDFANDCDTEAYPGGCSANLRPEAVDPDANDDLDQWSVPDPASAPEVYDVATQRMLATPGEASAVPEVLPACTAGDLAITEIMTTPKSDPQSNSSHEWFEVAGTGSDCDLSGCWLVQVEADGSLVDGTWSGGTPTGGKFTQVDAALPVRAGEHVLLSHGYSPIAVAGPDGLEVPSDYEYDYSSFWMSPEEGRKLAIYCGGDGTGADGDTGAAPSLEAAFGELVDEAPMSFDFLDTFCPDKGCSVNLPADAESPTANDEADAWCIPPLEGVYQDEEATFVGTPGQAGSCQTFAWPEPGELVFTEFMPDPAGTPDWFEMHNLAGRDLELSWCTITRYREEDGAETDVETSALAAMDAAGQPVPFTVGADAWQVFSYKACLDGGAGDTADTGGEDEGPVCPDGSFTYDRGSMTTSYREHMRLECGGQVIDEASVDASWMGLRKGHSAMLDPEAPGDPATANDDLDNWCEAAYTQPCFQVSDEACNYGTPGEENACLTDLNVIEGGPGCMCATGGSARGAAFAAWLGLLLGAVRRRRA